MRLCQCFRVILILGASSTLHWMHLSVCVLGVRVGVRGLCRGHRQPRSPQSWCNWMECGQVFEAASASYFNVFGLHSSIIITLLIYWLHPVLAVARRTLIKAHGLLSNCGFYVLGHVGSAVEVLGLSCLACGIFVPWLDIEPMSPALDGGFLTTETPEKSLFILINKELWSTQYYVKYILIFTL